MGGGEVINAVDPIAAALVLFVACLTLFVRVRVEGPGSLAKSKPSPLYTNGFLVEENSLVNGMLEWFKYTH